MAKKNEDKETIARLQDWYSIEVDKVEKLRKQLRWTRRMLTVMLKDVTLVLDDLEDEEDMA